MPVGLLCISVSFFGGFSNLLFDALNMPSTQGFNLAAQLEIAANFGILKYAEAVYNRQRAAGPCDHIIRIEMQIRLMRHSKNHCLRPLQCPVKTVLNANFPKRLLISEKPCP